MKNYGIGKYFCKCYTVLNFELLVKKFWSKKFYIRHTIKLSFEGYIRLTNTCIHNYFCIS